MSRLDANGARLLTGALGILLVALGLAAHGAAGAAGIAGGGLVIALAVTISRLRPLPTIGLLVLAVIPFAIITWWSVVSPLVALLTIVLGSAAVHEAASGHAPGARDEGTSHHGR